LALFAFLAAWNRFLYKKTGFRMWSPLWRAFSLTFGAILFIGARTAGYTLDRFNLDRLRTGTAWSDSVIWWQVWTGLAAVPVAAYLCRRALRAMRG
jgi:hypothetical protein